MALTMKHDRQKRIREAAQRQVDRMEQERTERLQSVKAAAMLLSISTEGAKKRLPSELTSVEFDSLTHERKLTILNEYIERLRELGLRLLDEYEDNAGARDKIDKIADRINSAGELIVEIELARISPNVPETEREPEPSVGAAISAEQKKMIDDKVKSVIQERMNTN